MNAAVKVMDWSKRTIEEWMSQYGAYVQTCRMKSGNDPDNLGVNQIYWLIRENNKGLNTRKDILICDISDFEADEVRKLIMEMRHSRRICTSAKMAVLLFIEKHVRGMSLSQLENEFKMSRSSINNMIYAGKFYLCGHDKRLKLE